MAQLAIKGHATRGNEVIALLEVLGGKNTVPKLRGNDVSQIYHIRECNNEIVCATCTTYGDLYIVFTLEDFEEKFPYKVGDKVITKDKFIGTIADIKWQGDSFFVGKEEGDIIYTVQVSTTAQITYQKEDLQPYKEETTEERQYEELRMPLDDDDKLATEATIDGNKILPPNGYLIGKITQVDNGMLVEYVKQQPQYPNTYVECAKILNCFSAAHIDGYKNTLLEKFRKLLICRDAYWKIAGERMGLGKTWEPDWTKDTEKYVIYPFQYLYSIDVENYRNTFLAFPTREIRDAFYENFKDLIENVKELLLL